MKGVSIPINTLVMLAVAIIVLLAAVAWFMGAFGTSATEQTLRQNFHNACIRWSTVNCDFDNMPKEVCLAYANLTRQTSNYCSGFPNIGDDKKTVMAKRCGCSEPFGTGV